MSETKTETTEKPLLYIVDLDARITMVRVERLLEALDLLEKLEAKIAAGPVMQPQKMTEERRRLVQMTDLDLERIRRILQINKDVRP